MIRSIFVIGVGMVLIGTVAAQSSRQDAADVPPVLKKFFESRKTSRYSGVRTVQFKRALDRKSHIEYILKDGIRLRTEFPDESEYRGQIIVENEKQRMHFYPDRNEIEVEPARRRDGQESSEGRGSRRKMIRTVLPGGQVAGFDTQLVNIADANGNVMQKMWIEPKTGVRLKLLIFDGTGAQSGSYEFTKINFRPTFANNDFNIIRKGATIVTPSMQARRLAEKHGLTPLTLASSSGFELQNARIIHPEQKDVLVQTYVGKSGRFSFFQLRGSVDEKRLSRFARGRLSTYAWQRGQESFAIVGSLNQDQLRQIAKTLGDS